MALKNVIYDGGGDSGMYEIDPDVLQSHIEELEKLQTQWENTVETAPDVGECGGSTIIQIEEMGNMFQRMQDAYVLLLKNTISYMKNRKDSVETKETSATNKVQEK